MKKIIMFVLSALVLVLNILSVNNVVYAEYGNADANGDSGEYFNVCDYTGHDNGSSKFIPDNVLYFKGGNLKNVACYVVKNYRTDNDGTVINRYCFKTSLTLPVTIKREFWKNFLGQGKTDRKSQISSSNTSAVPVEASEASVHCYIFSDESKVNAYLQGKIDAKSAENYDDLINTEGGYDKTLPFYNRAGLTPVNGGNVGRAKMTYQASMVGDMLSLYDEQKEAGKQMYIIYESYAIYMNSTYWTKLQAFYETYGFGKKFAEKVKERIVIDSSGRLDIDYLVAPGASGGGGRHTGKLFNLKSQSSATDGTIFAALTDDAIYIKDKYQASTTFSKSLSSNLFNGDTWLKRFTTSPMLIGYTTVIQPYYIVDGQVVYATPTYSYNWVYKSLRDAIGEGSYSYDPTAPDVPVDPVDPVVPPDTPDPDPDVPDSWDALSYVKNVYSQITGYIALTRQAFSFLPDAIWNLILAGLGVTLLICVFKLIRG